MQLLLTVSSEGVKNAREMEGGITMQLNSLLMPSQFMSIYFEVKSMFVEKISIHILLTVETITKMVVRLSWKLFLSI